MNSTSAMSQPDPRDEAAAVDQPTNAIPAGDSQSPPPEVGAQGVVGVGTDFMVPALFSAIERKIDQNGPAIFGADGRLGFNSQTKRRLRRVPIAAAAIPWATAWVGNLGEDDRPYARREAGPAGAYRTFARAVAALRAARGGPCPIRIIVCGERWLAAPNDRIGRIDEPLWIAAEPQYQRCQIRFDPAAFSEGSHNLIQIRRGLIMDRIELCVGDPIGGSAQNWDSGQTRGRKIHGVCSVMPEDLQPAHSADGCIGICLIDTWFTGMAVPVIVEAIRPLESIGDAQNLIWLGGGASKIRSPGFAAGLHYDRVRLIAAGLWIDMTGAVIGLDPRMIHGVYEQSSAASDSLLLDCVVINAPGWGAQRRAAGVTRRCVFTECGIGATGGGILIAGGHRDRTPPQEQRPDAGFTGGLRWVTLAPGERVGVADDVVADGGQGPHYNISDSAFARVHRCSSIDVSVEHEFSHAAAPRSRPQVNFNMLIESPSRLPVHNVSIDFFVGEHRPSTESGLRVTAGTLSSLLLGEHVVFEGQRFHDMREGVRVIGRSREQHTPETIRQRWRHAFVARDVRRALHARQTLGLSAAYWDAAFEHAMHAGAQPTIQERE